MKNLILSIIILLMAFATMAQFNYAKLVDPLIGTKKSNGDGVSSGYTYIGATHPYNQLQT